MGKSQSLSPGLLKAATKSYATITSLIQEMKNTLDNIVSDTVI